MPDIDIDFADRQGILDKIPHTRASIIDAKGTKSHNTGVYFTDCPVIPQTNQSSIDYKVLESLGYFKLDLLNVNIYSMVKSRQHLQDLIDTEPQWEKLQDRSFVDQLFHLNGHFEVVSKLKPKTLEEIACCLAIIRPAKRHLLNKSWNDIHKEVWTKPNDGQYFFKKAHAISYAMAVTVHMNLLCGA
jgi:hypothetical protein